MPMVIRAAFVALFLLSTLSAHAAHYLLTCGAAPCAASDGTTQSAGTALARIVWDGAAPYSPPAGLAVVLDDGRPIYRPGAAQPTVISAGAFFARFTAAETLAVQTAAQTNATIGVGLTHGLAVGQITLTDPVVKAWMDALVAANAITADRETAILTP